MNTSKSLDDFDRILWHALASAVTASINSDSNDTVDLTEQVFEQAKKDLLAAIVEAVEGLLGPNENSEGNKPHGDVRNQLRDELMQAIKEWQNHGE